jgi:MFS family permease
LIKPIYLPCFAGHLGPSMLIPVLPLYLTDSGLSLRLTAVVLASAGLGASTGGLPTGALIAKIGERRTMLAMLTSVAVSSALVGVTTAAIALMVFRAAAGASLVGMRLAQQTFVARRVGADRRGRSMSMIGGSARIAFFVGPLLGGVLADTIGFRSTFLISGVLTAIGIVPILLAGSNPIPVVGMAGDLRQRGIATVVRVHWKLLLLAGIAPLLVTMVREGRFVVMPLISDDLGLSPTAIGVVVAVSTGADLVLFPFAGIAMDRFGRIATILPAFTCVGLGHIMLGVADTTSTVVVAGVVIGVGSGLSSGSMLTIGGDIAPADSTGAFLAGMATVQEVGTFLGPLLVGLVGASAGLGASSIALAIVLGTAMLWLAFVVGETSGRPGPRSRLPSAVRPLSDQQISSI